MPLIPADYRTAEQRRTDRLHIEAMRLTEIETGVSLAHLQWTKQSTVAWRAIYRGHMDDLTAELAAVQPVTGFARHHTATGA